MKKVTSITVLTTAEGKRASVTYSEIDGSGKIIRENERTNRIVVDGIALDAIRTLEEYAQSIIED